MLLLDIVVMVYNGPEQIRRGFAALAQRLGSRFGGVPLTNNQHREAGVYAKLNQHSAEASIKYQGMANITRQGRHEKLLGMRGHDIQECVILGNRPLQGKKGFIILVIEPPEVGPF